MNEQDNFPSLDLLVPVSLQDKNWHEQYAVDFAAVGEVMQIPMQREMNVFLDEWTKLGRLDASIVSEVIGGKTIATKGYWESINYLLKIHDIRLTPFEAVVLFRLETILQPINEESFKKINQQLARNFLWQQEAADHASKILISSFGKISKSDEEILKHNFFKKVVPNLKFKEVEKKRQVVYRELSAGILSKSIDLLQNKNINRFLPNLQSEQEYTVGILNLQEAVASKLTFSGKPDFSAHIYQFSIDSLNETMKIFVNLTEEKLAWMLTFKGSKKEIFLQLSRFLITEEALNFFGAAYLSQAEAIADYVQQLFKSGVFVVEREDEQFKLSVSPKFKTYLGSE